MSRTKKVAYVSFTADINPQSTELLLSTCAQLANDGHDVVYLLLSTPGGNVTSGVTLYNVLRGMPFELMTHNVGSVNSIGNVLYLAGSRRYACPTSTFMFHGVGFDIPQAARLEEKALRELMGGIGADQKRIASIIAERSSLPQDQVERFFAEAVTKDAEYAKANGIAHDIRDVSLAAGAPIIQVVSRR